jgi:hypothetical protein
VIKHLMAEIKLRQDVTYGVPFGPKVPKLWKSIFDFLKFWKSIFWFSFFKFLKFRNLKINFLIRKFPFMYNAYSQHLMVWLKNLNLVWAGIINLVYHLCGWN